LELLRKHDCLALTRSATVHTHWQDTTQDQDLVHLGHAALLYRQQDKFLWFDPWLMPWFAESAEPSLWTSLLPRPTAIFLTHDHDDHVDPRTLLHLPKDTPIIVPSRRNRKALYYDYLSLMRELGFTRVIELAHGESWRFDGGAVVSKDDEPIQPQVGEDAAADSQSGGAPPRNTHAPHPHKNQKKNYRNGRCKRESSRPPARRMAAGRI
jgi:hypothetical protein